jgi:hypothetical protein
MTLPRVCTVSKCGVADLLLPSAHRRRGTEVTARKRIAATAKWRLRKVALYMCLKYIMI